MLGRTGPLTSNVAEAGAFVTSGAGLVAPDLQFHVAPAFFVAHGFTRLEGHGLTIGPTLLSPRSRGRLSLRSSDPRDPPKIDVRALMHGEELAAMRHGVALAREIAATPPLRSYIAHERFPGPAERSDAEIDLAIRRHVELLYHPVGTCAMGPASTAVVDPQGRVHGVQSLRVVDASIMPEIVGGNTNAPTIMMAHRIGGWMTL
jgi:choline dehydrogenase